MGDRYTVGDMVSFQCDQGFSLQVGGQSNQSSENISARRSLAKVQKGQRAAEARISCHLCVTIVELGASEERTGVNKIVYMFQVVCVFFYAYFWLLRLFPPSFQCVRD